MLVTLMQIARVTSLDVAAAVDLSDKRVREMCAGQRPVAAEHLLLMWERLPEVRAVLETMLAEMLGGTNVSK
jgi:hypothetical protein